MSHTRMATLAFILSELFSLDGFRGNFVSAPLQNLKTVWNILIILYSKVEQVMTMCPKQDWQLSILYFVSYLSLIISYAISCPLCKVNTLRNIIMILHSYVEQVMTMCHVQE